MISGGPTGTFAAVYQYGTDGSGYGKEADAGVYFFGSSSSGGTGRASGRTVISATRTQAPPYSQLRAAKSQKYPVRAPIPQPLFARGPKSAGIALTNYRTVATAAGADAQVVFYRWGIERHTGLHGYIEFVVGANALTLGGIGLGEIYTTTDSEPGKGDNPGCLLYLESGVATIWNNGVSWEVGAFSTGTRFGVAFSVGSTEVALRFYVDGAQVVEAEYAPDGPMVLPVLCTLAASAWSVRDSRKSLTFVPDGYIPVRDSGAVLFDFERECVPTDEPLVTIEWDSDLSLYNTNAVCRATGGTGCAAPLPNSTVLFSWGSSTLGTGSANNSRKTWTNTGAAFRLTAISFSATAAGVGSGVTNPTINGGVGHTAGVGAAPAWEWNQAVQDTLLSEAMVRVTVTPSGGTASVAEDYLLGTSDTGWYGNPPPPFATNTLATPVAYTMPASALSADDIIVNTNATINFRLFESLWNGQTQGGPDLVYAPMTIKLYGVLV